MKAPGEEKFQLSVGAGPYPPREDSKLSWQSPQSPNRDVVCTAIAPAQPPQPGVPSAAHAEKVGSVRRCGA